MVQDRPVERLVGSARPRHRLNQPRRPFLRRQIALHADRLHGPPLLFRLALRLHLLDPVRARRQYQDHLLVRLHPGRVQLRHVLSHPGGGSGDEEDMEDMAQFGWKR